MAETTYEFRAYCIAGPDGYPPEWHQSLKHLVRELAGHRCVRCLHPYKCGENGRGEWTTCDAQCQHLGPYRCKHPAGTEWHETLVDCEATIAGTMIGDGYLVEARWRILTVHHLDGNKLNCRWWNLAALCQRCHLQIQGKVRLERPWLFDHAGWFRPYVAGYYAWSILKEELDREQTMARLDELLELGRVRQMPQPLQGA